MDLSTLGSHNVIRKHCVQPTDYNLSVVSKHYYGTPDHALVIYQANRSILDDPNRIQPGQVLIIPHIPHMHS